MTKSISRRRFIRDSSLLTTGTLLAGGTGITGCGPADGPPRVSGEIVVDPASFCELSPHFYMQFMEPLGSTDGSVDSAWDYLQDDWRGDMVETVRDLAPDSIRWGGAFARYYKWREGVGPPSERPRMLRKSPYSTSSGSRRTDSVAMNFSVLISSGVKTTTPRGEKSVFVKL